MRLRKHLRSNVPRRLSLLKIAVAAGLAGATLLLICVLTLFLFPGFVADHLIKPRIIEAFAEAYPAYSLRIDGMSYSPVLNRLSSDSVVLSAGDRTLMIEMDSIAVSGIGWIRLLWDGHLTPAVLASTMIEANNIVLHLEQGRYVYRCDSLRIAVADGTIDAGAVALLHSDAENGSFSLHSGPFSVNGVGWTRLFSEGRLMGEDFATAAAVAREITVRLPHDQYLFHCAALRISVPDSEIVVEGVKLHPSGNDDRLFAGSEFRTTRVQAVVPYARAAGVACLALLEGNDYRARSAILRDATVDFLVNRDKPYKNDGPVPQMPHELLSSIEGSLQLDSLTLINGELTYGERSTVGSPPAVIKFDHMWVRAEGITNHARPGAAVRIEAQGVFMEAGTMKARMTIPLAAPGFSYRYSGSLSKTDLSALNVFLEPAEQIRIKTGVLESAIYKINVVSGRAAGTVWVAYRDLKFAAINKQTGSEKGFIDRISSFVANKFKFRGNNVPDGSGSMKTGVVAYGRKRDDLFLEFTWFALRSGVGDLVGF